MQTILDLKNNHILPFEIDDVKLLKLFSFFLHSAPTIESMSSVNCDLNILDKKWQQYISSFKKENYYFYSSNYKIPNNLSKFLLNDECAVNKNSYGFVTNLKDKDEKEYACFLRHIRNAIAIVMFT